ncbi:hypothetical protein WQ59_23515 [Streptomyces sp. KE1]|nr:hypothetical protein WQ59_23515 [Streptomyces sp. KE1]
MLGSLSVASAPARSAVASPVGVVGEPLADSAVAASVTRPSVGGPVRPSVVAVGGAGRPGAVVLAEGASGWAGRWVGEAGEGRGEGAPGEAELCEREAELGKE